MNNIIGLIKKSTVLVLGSIPLTVNAMDLSANKIMSLDMVIALAIAFLSVLLFLLARSLYKYSRVSSGSLAFDSNKFTVGMVLVLILLVLISLVGSMIVVKQHKQSLVAREFDTLKQSILALEHDILSLNSIRLGVHKHISSKPQFQEQLKKLIKGDDGVETIAFMTNFFDKYKEFGAGRGKIILSPKGQILLRLGNFVPAMAYGGQVNSPFDLALQGEHTTTAPLAIKDANNKVVYRTYSVAPIFNTGTKEVIAVSVDELNEKEVAYSDLSRYNFGQTGETLLFGENAEILVNSASSLLESLPRQPIYELKSQSLNKPAFTNIFELIENDGRMIYAVAYWQPTLNYGIMAKVKQNEVLVSHYDFRNGVIIILCLMTFFMTTLFLFTFYVGRQATKTIKESRDEIISRLGQAAEYKDTDTAKHIQRISEYSRVLAEKLPTTIKWRELLIKGLIRKMKI